MSKEKFVSLAKIGPLLDTNEDNFSFYVDNAFIDFISENGDPTEPIDLFKAGAEWFRSIVQRNIDNDFTPSTRKIKREKPI